MAVAKSGEGGVSRSREQKHLSWCDGDANHTRKGVRMQYSTLPFTLVTPDQTYLIDVGAIYSQAQRLLDYRKARAVQHPLALIITLAVLAKQAGYSRL